MGVVVGGVVGIVVAVETAGGTVAVETVAVVAVGVAGTYYKFPRKRHYSLEAHPPVGPHPLLGPHPLASNSLANSSSAHSTSSWDPRTETHPSSPH